MDPEHQIQNLLNFPHIDWSYFTYPTLWQTNTAMENPPFEDVSPIKNGAFPASYVRITGLGPNFFQPTVSTSGSYRDRSIWVENQPAAEVLPEFFLPTNIELG